MLSLLLRLGAAAAAVLVVYVGVLELLPRRRNWLLFTAIAGLVLFAVFLAIRPGNLLVSNFAVLAAATLLGCAIASFLPGEIAVAILLLVVAAADWMGLLTEPLARAIAARSPEGSPPGYQFLATTIPLGGRLLPIAWLDELAVCACLFYATDQLGHSRLIALPVALLALVGANWVSLRSAAPIPAIPVIAAAAIGFLGVSWLIARPRAGKPEGNGRPAPATQRTTPQALARRSR